LSNYFIDNYSNYFQLKNSLTATGERISIVRDAKAIPQKIEKIESNKDITGSQLPTLKSYLENLEFKGLSKSNYYRYVNQFNRSLGRMQRYMYDDYQERYVSVAARIRAKSDTSSSSNSQELTVSPKPIEKKKENAFITNLSSIFSNVKSYVQYKKLENKQPDSLEAEPPNYAEIYESNADLGLQGELFVLNREKKKLIELGRKDLADNVEHTSIVKGNNHGYDILSFDNLGDEIYIEVKTTKLGVGSSFYLTSN
jgi:Domain of unknown function (DUF3883)